MNFKISRSFWSPKQYQIIEEKNNVNFAIENLLSEAKKKWLAFERRTRKLAHGREKKRETAIEKKRKTTNERSGRTDTKGATTKRSRLVNPPRSGATMAARMRERENELVGSLKISGKLSHSRTPNGAKKKKK